MMRRDFCNWTFAMGILLSGAACSSDERTPDVDSRSIRFAVSPAIHDDGETRAVVNGSYLPEASEVGIFAYSYPVEDEPAWPEVPNIFTNMIGTVGAIPDETGDPQAITIAEDDEQYYAIGRQHAFYSYYPYVSSLSENRIVQSDLFSDLDADDTQKDWLWAEPVLDVMASLDPVPFRYSHTMSLVRFKVAKVAELDATLRLESITVGTSTSQKFVFDISTGEVSGQTDGATTYTVSLLSDDSEDEDEGEGEDDGEDKGWEVPATAEVASDILLLPASQVTSLSFRVNGEDFTTPSEWKGFPTSSDGGKYRLVNIEIKLYEISIELGQQEWEDGDDVDLTQSNVSISLGAKDWEYDPATDIDMTQSKVSISLGAKGWVDYDEPIPIPAKKK